jgi:hypothetical protein
MKVVFEGLYPSFLFLVAQAGLELVILLPQFPNAGITGMCYHTKSIPDFK